MSIKPDPSPGPCRAWPSAWQRTLLDPVANAWRLESENSTEFSLR